MSELEYLATQADRCHRRLVDWANRDSSKWTPQYQQILDAHAEREANPLFIVTGHDDDLSYSYRPATIADVLDRARQNQEQARVDKAEVDAMRAATNLDLMYANAYPESWVRDIMLGLPDPPVRCQVFIGRGQCELEDGHDSHHVSGKWMKFNQQPQEKQ